MKSLANVRSKKLKIERPDEQEYCRMSNDERKIKCVTEAKHVREMEATAELETSATVKKAINLYTFKDQDNLH